MGIEHFIPPILRMAFQKLAAAARRKYKIGKYEVDIPPYFVLPQYQKSDKLYDRFLPVLGKNLSSDKLVIDVGANIGDTAIALVQNCTNPIMCIEPSDRFFPYLVRNLQRMSVADFSRVKAVKQLIGTGLISGTLCHDKRGTASVRVINSSDSPAHIALDKLVDDVSNVLLLKVDTDGFDFDVIRSAQAILCHSEPILFWENEILEDFQMTGFDELYSLLQEMQYKYIYIFDNFGNLMTEEVDFATLRNINSYVYCMRKHNCTRTIYYTDILASTERNHAIVEKAVNEYRVQWINK